LANGDPVENFSATFGVRKLDSCTIPRPTILSKNITRLLVTLIFDLSDS